MGVGSRLKQMWSAFSPTARQPTQSVFQYMPVLGTTEQSGRVPLSVSTERSVVSSLYNRIALDVASLDFRHVKIDTENDDRYSETIDSKLNYCLKLRPNLDQVSKHLINSTVQFLFDKGTIALIPVEADDNPNETGSFDIKEIRVAEITKYFPDEIQCSCYNEKTGNKQEIIIKKKIACIMENPFFTIMNTPNSVVKRLILKLNQLDMVDKQSTSGKWNLIIQVPYQTNHENQQKRAQQRIDDIESQLSTSPHGVAYIDGTEKVIQLNRAIETNLMAQIEFLTTQLFSQLGITTGILDGSANEQTMTNYYTRIVDVIAGYMCDCMTRSWLSKTAYTQGQRIMFFRDPFKFVSPTNFAELSDKLTRNAIMSSNEIRSRIGLRPSPEKDADALRNKNLNMAANEQQNIDNQTEPKFKMEGEKTDG